MCYFYMIRTKIYSSFCFVFAFCTPPPFISGSCAFLASNRSLAQIRRQIASTCTQHTHSSTRLHGTLQQQQSLSFGATWTWSTFDDLRQDHSSQYLRRTLHHLQSCPGLQRLWRLPPLGSPNSTSWWRTTSTSIFLDRYVYITLSID
jgi:hypothetical protein